MIEIFKEIYETILRNKLRTALTGFSVAWGIFILIVLLGAGNGVINGVMSENRRTDGSIVLVYGNRTSVEYKGIKDKSVKLTNKQIDYVRKELSEYIESVGGGVYYSSNWPIRYKGDQTRMTVVGSTKVFADHEQCKIVAGRMLNDTDVKEKRRVVVVTHSVCDQLFNGDANAAVGEIIDVLGVGMRVVGVMEKYRGWERAIIPYTTMQNLMGYIDGYVDEIMIKTKGLKTDADYEMFEQKIRKALATSLEYSPDDQKAIWYSSTHMNNVSTNKALSAIRTALWVLGLLTLVTGIVGVSNIMLITVKERTREFGIRKAIGATPFSILKSVIIESVIITLIFGYIGIVFGVATTELMDYFLGDKSFEVIPGEFFTMFKDPTVDISVAIRATITLVLAGTLAGFFPARRAVMIKTIDAIRG